MRGLTLVFVIALLPALAALGHDIYLFYENYGLDSVPRDVERQIADKGPLSFFATLGFIWTRYAPGAYKLMSESVSEENWAVINLLLKQKAFFAGLVLAALVMVVAFILRLCGIGTEGGGRKSWGKAKDNFDAPLLSRDKHGGMKYKRK